jgi:hypothetical protein
MDDPQFRFPLGAKVVLISFDRHAAMQWENKSLAGGRS